MTAAAPEIGVLTVVPEPRSWLRVPVPEPRSWLRVNATIYSSHVKREVELSLDKQAYAALLEELKRGSRVRSHESR